MDGEANALKPGLAEAIEAFRAATAELHQWKNLDWTVLDQIIQRRGSTLEAVVAQLSAEPANLPQLEQLRAAAADGERALHRVRILRATAAAERAESEKRRLFLAGAHQCD